MLQKNKSITNQEIQDMFGISYDSAKRDLRLLEEQGMLKRTHGGAISRETIGAEFGLSIQRTRNLCLYNTLLASAEKVYGLYPAGKIGTDSIISICPINALDVLITDDDALEEDLKAIEENGVEILLTI